MGVSFLYYFQVPMILTYLQRSVHAVLLGKTSRPDWLACGAPKSALIDRLSIKIMTGLCCFINSF